MSTVQEIESAIRALPRGKAEELREWLEEYLEDQLDLTEEFQANIDRGKADIAEGRVRRREPEST